MIQHEKYIRRCLNLAEKALGSTYPNPMVGSVIVHNDRIIGEGYHHKSGENHAEINAIASVADQSEIAQSTIYVSLEPCSHYGKTPPCAVKLAELGFKKVVIGTLDPHSKVNGRGKEILEKAGIEVIAGVLEKECQELNKRFFTYHQKKRPYITLKWAQSGDSFIDKNFQPTAISNSVTRQYVHQLRAEEHAILVGVQTALSDNPSLTTRDVVGRNPVRILLDPQLTVPRTSIIFNAEAPTVVFNEIKEEKESHIQLIKLELSDFSQDLMQKMYEGQIQSLLVEGGRKTLNKFISAGLWDEIIIIRNPDLNLVHGTPAPDFSAKPYRHTVARNNVVEFYRNKG